MSVKKLPQRGLFEAKSYFGPMLEGQKSAEKFYFFREKVWPKLKSMGPRLEEMYCEENGRPGVNPVRLLATTILQFTERLPDRDAAERVVCDVRWRIALEMDLEEKGFDSTVLVRFRDRLLEHGKESVGFDAALDVLREAGYLTKKKRGRVDSTHVLGLVAQMSRLECVREAMRLALEALESEERLSRPESWPQWWERYVESKPDYKAKVEILRLKMNQAGQDAHAMLSWVKTLPEEVRKIGALEVLGKVFEENFECTEQGAVDQRRAQPAGAVHNPNDPEAHWSCKDTTKRKEWVGYKAQVAETVEEEPREKGEPTKSVITAIVTQDAIASDKAALPVVEKALEASGEAKPEITYTDAGYSSGAELARAQEEGRELKAPMQPSPERDGRYTAEEFDVSVENRVAVCPAGKQSTNCSRMEEAKTGKVTVRFEWNNGICGECPVRGKCLGNDQKHRSLLVGEHHDLVQARRKEQKTREFKQDMRHRNGIEGTISELARGYGLRRCRYRGQARTRLQNLFIGAACNIKRWFRRVTWEARNAAENALSAAASVATT